MLPTPKTALQIVVAFLGFLHVMKSVQNPANMAYQW